MNLRPIISAAVLCALPSALRAADTSSADPGSFEKTHERIEALFRGRDATPILPANLPDPFSRPDDRRLRPRPSEAANPVLSDRALLERLAPAIQIRGIVEAAGRPSIIINRKLFEAGDKLTVLYGDSPVEIVIKQITSETFTLGYKDAELTLRLPR